ncbi:PREDICTED: RCC1 and BTB domain-containing protein 2-like [Acromyrmex echinatior]|uniref:RCC1 and BTB domain-containing protein 2-like n=1 Tax=Acromyrmex echinatior TaxID=103372 RepID=UPI000580B69B|nr:PREDICTED: RCC1 and BTB domain-containing protein 2-like [Acromyrmex echinatior]
MSISLKFDENQTDENIDLITFKRWLGLQSCINCKNGTGYIDKEYHPTKADIMFKKKIKMLIANITYNGIAFLVTQDVEKYVWEDKNAKMTFNFEVQSTDNKVENKIEIMVKLSHYIYYTSHKIDWSNTRIIKAATNKSNFLVLTDDGKIYYTNGWIEGKKCSIHEINIEEKITCISCGINFFVIITDNYKMYCWGICDNDQLSLCRTNSKMIKKHRNLDEDLTFTTYTQYDEIVSSVERPCEITAFKDKIIVKVACGIDYILVLSNKGKLYGWGSNIYDQFNKSYNTSPIKIYIKNVKKISDIAVIDYKSFVKSSVGHIYMWGFIFNVPIKKYVPCEFTNAFDIFNSTTALSPMSMAMAYEFINEELHILNDLETAFDDQSTSDLTIMVKKQSIYVHKVILIIRSTYFRSVLQTIYVENRYIFTKKKHHSE